MLCWFYLQRSACATTSANIGINGKGFALSGCGRHGNRLVFNPVFIIALISITDHTAGPSTLVLEAEGDVAIWHLLTAW